MIQKRSSRERGYANHEWLETYHSFSFARYYDSKHMNFRYLRVINEDRVQPGTGFGMHSHHDMEIITYILDGSLKHQDSMGNQSIIYTGEVQHISAGTGIMHSELNPSESDPVHFLQIWITPDRMGIEPRYAQRKLRDNISDNQLCLIASKNGENGSITLNQDVNLYVLSLDSGGQVDYELQPDRYAWIQVTKGTIKLKDITMEAGDGAAISEEKKLEINANNAAEMLLFDLS
ncbi:TPA: pirin family protein [Candidatus Poribacteria bacterium]|nr:pirin family protein [Candidatus Poribacteria bacterium]HIC03297.1 pirin family protein [Candidatus Poribacteria bacterium]HIC17838.1 pirin family protein [Candidatus Poribacteria bacterium]HIO05388.1 pirin family protein [Candidatus Poribacteria bacterium]HIO49489.1 pirin family protein [Candidatus Poribacteria bacterium]